MLEIVFWAAVGLLVYAQVGYPLVLLALTRLVRGRTQPARAGAEALPSVTLIVAAHDEQRDIAAKVANALALDYPRERLELIVASDGSADATVERARAAGADDVLDLPRGGKVAAQNAAAERARGELLVFSDANSAWRPDALRLLVAAFEDPRVGYAVGQVKLLADDGATSQEGAYWRYEMGIRALESGLGGVTSGNGAIYAVRREAYVRVDERMGHDLSLPFNMVKHGWRPVYVAGAQADEKMIPSAEGEYRRKRRMASYGWLITVQGGMLSPRGYGLLYAFQIASHRVLRYLAPFLHVVALAANVALLGEGLIYTLTLALQGALLVAAALGPFVPAKPLRIAYYYVLVTTSLVTGMWRWLRGGAVAWWDTPEEAR